MCENSQSKNQTKMKNDKDYLIEAKAIQERAILILYSTILEAELTLIMSVCTHIQPRDALCVLKMEHGQPQTAATHIVTVFEPLSKKPSSQDRCSSMQINGFEIRQYMFCKDVTQSVRSSRCNLPFSGQPSCHLPPYPASSKFRKQVHPACSRHGIVLVPHVSAEATTSLDSRVLSTLK